MKHADASPQERVDYLRAARAQTQRYLEELEAHMARVQDNLAAIAARNARDSVEYVLVEEENTKLANRYVSCARLDRCEGRAEVIDAIQEIIINLVGSEELALFEVNGSALSLLASFGMDGDRLDAIIAGEGAVKSAARGEHWVIDGPVPIMEEETGLTACVPLRVGGEVTGVIAIFQLLPHKLQLEAFDLELIDLLATHAANALYRTRIGA
jgi:GAF domain-containing protein